jgi:hypothetical protein
VPLEGDGQGPKLNFFFLALRVPVHEQSRWWQASGTCVEWVRWCHFLSL